MFQGKAHPSTLGASEISAFLTWLAVRQHVSASTQNQALSALLFLHRHVLGMEVGEIGQVPRARVPVRVPVVLSRDEVGAVMTHVTGPLWIIVVLLYGAGLRIQECLELRLVRGCSTVDGASNSSQWRSRRGEIGHWLLFASSLMTRSPRDWSSGQPLVLDCVAQSTQNRTAL